MNNNDWEFDAEACCKAIKEHQEWEYQQMRLQDTGMKPAWGFKQPSKMKESLDIFLSQVISD